MAVRREKIILEVEDRGSAALARMAGEVAALDRALATLDQRNQQNSQSTDRHRDAVRQLNDEYERQQRLLRSNLPIQQNVIQRTTQAGREFDRASGRMRMFVDAAVLLGPALIPVGAVAVPAITGLANQLGIAALAAGTAVVAFQGVGDAVGAMNDAAVEPTVDNFAKLDDELSKLSPTAKDFALQIGAMRSNFRGLRDAAAAGMFPEITRELQNIDPLLGRLEDMLFSIGSATGTEVARGLNSLNSDRWTGFFDFLAREAGPTMRDLAQVIGNSAHALSGMWMAFQPLNRDFGDWLVGVTADWDAWAAGLADNEGFQDFIDYIQNNGPRVAETLGAIGGMFVDIIEAASPLGGPVLKALEAVADVVSTIADSEFGTPLLAGLAAMTLLRRGAQLTSAAMGSTFVGSLRQTATGVRNLRSDYQAAAASGGIFARQIQPMNQQLAAQRAQAERLRSTLGNLGKGAVALGGLGIAASGAADGLGFANTISLGMMGTLAGPWGAAVGASVGLLMDFSAASDAAAEAQRAVKDSVADVADTLNPISGALTDSTREMVLQALAADDGAATAQRFGYSLEEVADIVLGTGGNFTEFTSNLRDSGGAGEEFATKVTILANELRTAQNDFESLADKTGTAASAFEEAADAIDRMSEAYAAWADTLGAFDAETAQAGALRDLAAVVEETGASFDASTESGQAFRDALSGWSSATEEVLNNAPVAQHADIINESIQELADTLGISVETAWQWASEVGISMDTVGAATAGAEAQALNLKGSFDSLPEDVRTAVQLLGFPKTKSEAETLADRFDLAAEDRDTLLTLQSQAAELGISTFLGMVNAIKPEYRTTITATRYEITRRQVIQDKAASVGGWDNYFRQQAHGGLYPTVGAHHAVATYAAGGLDIPNGHRPEIYRGGVTRIWGEPETRGEAYIPLANDGRRGRAESILSEVAGIFGGRYEKYATGGIRGGGTSTVVVQSADPALRAEIAALRQAMTALPRAVESGASKGSQVGTNNGIRRNDRGFGASRKAGGL